MSKSWKAYICQGIHHGWSYDLSKNRMIYDSDVRETTSEDQHMFHQLKEIANSLDIQMTVDTSSMHETGFLPVYCLWPIRA